VTSEAQHRNNRCGIYNRNTQFLVAVRKTEKRLVGRALLRCCASECFIRRRDGKQQGVSDVVSGNAENKPALSEAEGDTKERHAPEQAFADKLPRRSPPNKVERSVINKAPREPRAEMRIEDHGGTSRIFGSRSLQFVNSMLRDIGKATEDHGESKGFLPGSPDELAFNAALAVIDGVRPKDEIEAMLAAHMAVTNIALLELVARMREAAAGHLYQGNGGTQRLQVFGNLTTKFMRTYAMQVEALARKRRTGEQRVTVKYVHVHPGAQAIVGNVHQRGRGVDKNDQRPYGRARAGKATTAVPKRSSVRGSNQERETMPVTRNRKGTVSSTWRCKRQRRPLRQP
jgi:hypothetical protein